MTTNKEKKEKKEIYNLDIIKGIFLLILAISGNFIAETLSCKTQRLLTNNITAKHIITILIFYFTTGFIQNDATPLHPYESLKICLITYVLFLLFTKMNLKFTILTFIIIALIYINFTFLDYYRKIESYRVDLISFHRKINSILFMIMYVLIFIGFILNLNKQYHDHKNNFSLMKYLFNVQNCKY